MHILILHSMCLYQIPCIYNRHTLLKRRSLPVEPLSESYLHTIMCTLEKRGNLFILTLTGDDDEHRLNPTLIQSIRSSLHQIRTESKPGSVLITTAQGKFFSNGFDLNWAQSSESRQSEMVLKFKSIISDLISLPLPTIAAISGHAVAAGFMFALSHDYVLMRKDRGFVYMSELDIGLTFSDYFMVLMKSKISSWMARRELVLKSSKMKAERAVELGIIDSAYDSVEETMNAALRLGENLAARKWKGEVYADIRIATYPEISELLGLIENQKKKSISSKL